jgi:hypothetical protein
MSSARAIWHALLIALAAAAFLPAARAADAPVITSIVDPKSGRVLWPLSDPTAGPHLKPGQEILLRGRNFGPGPLTAARPGLGPPAGGEAAADGRRSVQPSPAEAPGKELSKLLFGKVRALERNLSSYRARIDLGTGIASLLSRLRGKTLDYFVEPWDPLPDTWPGDIYAWSDTEIDVTVPITAYEGPIQVIRIPVTGAYVTDITTGAALLYVDPNTARVVKDGSYAFVDRWRIARTGESVLASNAVPVTIALDGADRLQLNTATASEAEERAARLAMAAADSRKLVKGTPTLRSAADQYAYGEKAFWAWDWNLALPHFVLGIDWNGIFGFDQSQSYLSMLVDSLKSLKTGISPPKLEAEGYPMPELAADGTLLRTVPHRALIDRSTGQGIRPYDSFGAVPLLPDSGAERVIAPAIAFGAQTFEGSTPYPIIPAFHLPTPLPQPLAAGDTMPTGWAGYVFAEVGSLIPGDKKPVDWIGFNCAACHADRVTYEYEPGGKRVSRFFAGIPNPNWKSTFLTLSSRGQGLVLDEELPSSFINADYPPGTRQRIESQITTQILRFLHGAHVVDSDTLSRQVSDASKQSVDKTLLIYNLPPGATESTLFNAANSPGDYGNDYFFSPQAIPIITDHTPVRRALSRSELIDGFEGAYLHGEEPEGARGPMTSRALQDLTLYDSTLHQEDELLRRIGMYRWLAHKGFSSGWLGGVNEGTFTSFGYAPGALLQPASFPPQPEPRSGLGSLRDAAVADPTGAVVRTDPFAQRFPVLATHILKGAALYQASCGRCHAAGNASLWTNEDMHPISAAGGSEPVGRFFSPTGWQRKTQSIRTAILENLFWVERRGLLSDGHVVGDAPDNMDGLDLLVRPERCQAPVNPDGTVDLTRASALYKKLYTIHGGQDHSFRIPDAGMPFAFYSRTTGVLQDVVSPDPARKVSAAEALFVARHAYFTKGDDGYLYWDYQKMRLGYGILEYGLDPANPQDHGRIGGLPAAPHPWCMPDGASQADIDDLVVFLLTL